MKKTVWTQFWDMSSGGGRKEDFHFLYIEAPEDEAVRIFYNRFGHNPRRVSCTCCGDDYSITESDSLEQATAYHRNCNFDKKKNKWSEIQRGGVYVGVYQSLADYLEKATDVKVIYDKDIKDEERRGAVPDQGYVWKD